MIKNFHKIIGISLGLIQLALSDIHPSYSPKDWPKHTVKFPADGTLKDIFDAGIRPYRFPSLERSALGFKHVHVTFKMNTGELLPHIPVEWADLDILKGGLISSIEMTSPNFAVEEAKVAMLPFLNKGNRTAAQLEAFLAAVVADPKNYDDPYYGDASGFQTVWNDIDGPNYVVFFKSTSDGAKPVSIALKISFFPIRTPLQERSFYDAPIPPPPGYENVSMDAPRNFGPDSAVEIARSKGLPITGDRTPEEYEKQQREANNKTRAPERRVPANEPKLKSPVESGKWLGLIALLGLITAILLVWRWKSKCSS